MSTTTPPHFNPEQLASYAEARALRSYINSTPEFAKNHILPGDDEDGSVGQKIDPNFPWLPVKESPVGIYLPKWESGPHGDPQPSNGDQLQLCFRMANGVDGLNVGMWRTKFQKYPDSPSYVLGELAKDAQNPQ